MNKHRSQQLCDWFFDELVDFLNEIGNPDIRYVATRSFYYFLGINNSDPRTFPTEWVAKTFKTLKANRLYPLKPALMESLMHRLIYWAEIVKALDINSRLSLVSRLGLSKRLDYFLPYATDLEAIKTFLLLVDSADQDYFLFAGSTDEFLKILQHSFRDFDTAVELSKNESQFYFSARAWSDRNKKEVFRFRQVANQTGVVEVFSEVIRI